MTTFKPKQTDDELNAIYIAWKMGAHIEIRSSYHNHQPEDEGRWLPHESYNETLAWGLDLNDTYLHLMAVKKDYSFAEHEPLIEDIEFRIKPNDELT